MAPDPGRTSGRVGARCRRLRVKLGSRGSPPTSPHPPHPLAEGAGPAGACRHGGADPRPRGRARPGLLLACRILQDVPVEEPARAAPVAAQFGSAHPRGVPRDAGDSQRAAAHGATDQPARRRHSDRVGHPHAGRPPPLRCPGHPRLAAPLRRPLSRRQPPRSRLHDRAMGGVSVGAASPRAPPRSHRTRDRVHAVRSSPTASGGDALRGPAGDG
jgi:hypothetical protein